MSDWNFDSGALEGLVRSDGAKSLEKSATAIRDRARQNARSIAPGRVGAISYEMGRDARGIYADIGYARHLPGWVLWFAEVGTVNQAPHPHLRPAVNAGRI